MEIRDLCRQSLQINQNGEDIFQKTNQILSNVENIIPCFEVLLNETENIFGQSEANLIKQLIYRHFKEIRDSDMINTVFNLLIQVFQSQTVPFIVKSNLIDSIFPIFDQILNVWHDLYEFVNTIFENDINLALTIMIQVSSALLNEELQQYSTMIANILHLGFSIDDIEILLKSMKLMSKTVLILDIDLSSYFEKAFQVFCNLVSSEIDQNCYKISESISDSFYKEKLLFEPQELLQRLANLETALDQAPWIVFGIIDKLVKIYGEMLSEEIFSDLVQLSLAVGINLCSKCEEIDETFSSYLDSVLNLIVKVMKIVTNKTVFIGIVLQLVESSTEDGNPYAYFVALSVYRLIIDYADEVLPVFIPKIAEKISLYLISDEQLIIKAAAECASEIASFAYDVYDCSELFSILIQKTYKIIQETNKFNISSLLKSMVPFLYYVNNIPQESLTAVCELCVELFSLNKYKLEDIYVISTALHHISDVSPFIEKIVEITKQSVEDEELIAAGIELLGEIVCSYEDESISQESMRMFYSILFGNNEIIIDNLTSCYKSLIKIAKSSNSYAKSYLPDIVKQSIGFCMNDNFIATDNPFALDCLSLILLFIRVSIKKLELEEDLLDLITQIGSVLISSGQNQIVSDALPLIMLVDVASNTDYDDDFKFAIECLQNYKRKIVNAALYALRVLIKNADDLFQYQIEEILHGCINVLTNERKSMKTTQPCLQTLAIASRKYAEFFNIGEFSEIFFANVNELSPYELSLYLTPFVAYYSSEISFDPTLAEKLFNFAAEKCKSYDASVPPHCFQLIRAISHKESSFVPVTIEISSNLLQQNTQGSYLSHAKLCCATVIISLYEIGAVEDELMKNAILLLGSKGAKDDIIFGFTSLVRLATNESTFAKFAPIILNLFNQIDLYQLPIPDELKNTCIQLEAAIEQGMGVN